MDSYLFYTLGSTSVLFSFVTQIIPASAIGRCPLTCLQSVVEGKVDNREREGRIVREISSSSEGMGSRAIVVTVRALTLNRGLVS